MQLSLEQVALELVRLEKSNPSVGMPDSTINIYGTYVKKPMKCEKTVQIVRAQLKKSSQIFTKSKSNHI